MLARLFLLCCGLALLFPARAEWIYPMNQGKVPMVPARYVAQWLGAVMTEGKKGAVTLVLEKKTVAFTVDQPTATVQGKAVKLQAPPRAKAGVIYLPAELLTAAWNVKVEVQPSLGALDPGTDGPLIILTRGTATLLLPQYIYSRDNQTVAVTPLDLDALNGLVSLAGKHLAGGQINLADRLGRVPLHFAAYAGQTAMVKWLLDHQAATDVEETYYAHLTPLRAALRTEHPDIALLIFRKGAYADAEDLGWAVHLDAVEVVKAMLERVPADPEAGENVTYPPLREAASRGNLEIVDLLLAKGAKADFNYLKRGTPLLTAIGNGHTEVIKRLLENGAALNAPVDVSKNIYLRESRGIGATRTPQFTEITPLQYAAYTGQVEIYRELLALGADPQAKTADGFSPLSAAAFGEKPSSVEMLKVLLDMKLPVSEATTGFGIRLNCLWFDAEKVLGDKNKIDVQLQLSELTPLHLAMLSRSDGTVATSFSYPKAELLLQSGADVNARTKGGLTPLHLAIACTSDSEVARLLIERGADINAKTDQGYTPLTFARLFNAEVAEKLLQKKGAKE